LDLPIDYDSKPYVTKHLAYKKSSNNIYDGKIIVDEKNRLINFFNPQYKTAIFDDFINGL